MVRKLPAKGKIASSPKPDDEVAERLTDMGTTNTHATNDTATQTKKTRLLSDPDVKRWHGNLARGSKITAGVYLRRLGKFCETHHTTPIALKDLAVKDIKTATDLLEDHVAAMETNGNSPEYIGGFVKSVKSWLGYSDVEVRRKIKISFTGSTPTLQDERVPDGDEMSEIYSRAGLRESAMISLMAKSGLRPQVMGNHDGTDGLKMRDLPDLVIHDGKAKCVRTPSRIIVRKELSKTNNSYLTFSTKSAIRHVVAYLNDRLVRYGINHVDVRYRPRIYEAAYRHHCVRPLALLGGVCIEGRIVGLEVAVGLRVLPLFCRLWLSAEIYLQAVEYAAPLDVLLYPVVVPADAVDVLVQQGREVVLAEHDLYPGVAGSLYRAGYV